MMLTLLLIILQAPGENIPPEMRILNVNLNLIHGFFLSAQFSEAATL